MHRRRFLHGLAALLLLGGLAGCAAPHYLQPEPRRSADAPVTGQGQTVTVMAVDGRDSDTLGTRSGSASSTAVITVEAHQLVPQLQAEAERAVREMGFTPTATPATGRPSLTLTLAQLGYARGDSPPLVGSARLEAVLVAEASNGTTTYTARRTQHYAIRPSYEANTRMVEALLSEGLDRAFADPELGRLLAR